MEENIAGAEKGIPVSVEAATPDLDEGGLAGTAAVDIGIDQWTQ